MLRRSPVGWWSVVGPWHLAPVGEGVAVAHLDAVAGVVVVAPGVCAGAATDVALGRGAIGQRFHSALRHHWFAGTGSPCSGHG